MHIKQQVKGERTVALIVDYIILQIILFILMLPITLLTIGGQYTFITIGVGMDPAGEDLMSFVIFTLVVAVVSFIVGFIYFAIVPWRMNGRTLGKALLSVKVIDEFGVNPSLKTHALRAIAIWDLYIGIPAAFLALAGFWAYTIVSTLIGFIWFIVMLVAFIMIMARGDERGLHDLIAGTYVVDVRYEADKELVEAATKAGDWADIEGLEDDADDFIDEDEVEQARTNDDPWEDDK